MAIADTIGVLTLQTVTTVPTVPTMQTMQTVLTNVHKSNVVSMNKTLYPLELGIIDRILIHKIGRKV